MRNADVRFSQGRRLVDAAGLLIAAVVWTGCAAEAPESIPASPTASEVQGIDEPNDVQARQSFQITPTRPIDEIRVEALAANPPEEPGKFNAPDLVDLETLDSRIKLEIRYATPDNFLGVPVYTTARAFLQRPAADALKRAQETLGEQGFGLLIYDGYRPWYVTKIFREATPTEFHGYVANPDKGSRHNRGCAVDLTLYDLKTGRPVDMPTGYDDFTERAFADAPTASPAQAAHRATLRNALEAEGFVHIPNEWWHFDYKDWSKYPILNVEFEKLAPAP